MPGKRILALLIQLETNCTAADDLAEAMEEAFPQYADAEVTLSFSRLGIQRDEGVLEVLASVVEDFRRDPTRCGVGVLWEVLPVQARVLEWSGRVDEAVRLLGADVAVRRYGSEDTVEFYAELLARQGRIEELRDLATATRRSTAAVRYVKALESWGRADEAESYLRGLIASGHPGWYVGALVDLLIRQGRFDDGIEAGRHTFDDLYDGNLLQSAIVLLAEQGQYDKAIALTEGRGPEFLAENGAWLWSNRWWLMGEAGRAQEAITEIEALSAAEVDDREPTIAWLLAQDGRVERAIARLRPLPGRRAATDLAELLIRQTRFAEAVAVIPGVAAQREEERHFWTGRPDGTEGEGSNR
ncbi:hypothetical protein [Streptomyces sp. NPDC048242]|uniref:hypothetical protein n=1 Tax=Streptomyces sp. NPDC048242 TaxID=3155026 RepID=UPI003447F105